MRGMSTPSSKNRVTCRHASTMIVFPEGAPHRVAYALLTFRKGICGVYRNTRHTVFFSECDNVGARCPLGACTTHGSVVVTSTLSVALA
jgi:hypothetical protein